MSSFAERPKTKPVYRYLKNRFQNSEVNATFSVKNKNKSTFEGDFGFKNPEPQLVESFKPPRKYFGQLLD